MASSGFRIKVGLNSTAAERGLANIGRSANRLNRRMGRLAGKGLKLAAGIGAASAAMAAFAAIKFIKDSSKAAADFEMMAGSFETLLGSASAAAERIKELMAFSVKTPFEPAELIKASKMLEVMGGETLAIGKGLTMIGDAATGASEPLEVIASHVGRMFMAMTTGQSFMEPLRELQKFAGVSKEGFLTLAELNKEMVAGRTAALSNADAFKKIQGAMGEWEGEMAKAAARHGGMVSTMKGNMELLKISFGEGINKGLNEGVKLMNEKIPEWLAGAKELGDAIGRGLGQAFTGNTKLLELQVSYLFTKMGEIAGAVFLRAMTTIISNGFANFLQQNEMLAGPKEFREGRGPVAGPGAGLFPAIGRLIQKEGTAEDFDMSSFLEFTKGTLGSEALMKEINAELVRVREAIEEAPVVEKKAAEEVAITSTVFGGVTYHHAR